MPGRASLVESEILRRFAAQNDITWCLSTITQIPRSGCTQAFIQIKVRRGLKPAALIALVISSAGYSSDRAA